MLLKEGQTVHRNEVVENKVTDVQSDKQINSSSNMVHILDGNSDHAVHA